MSIYKHTTIEPDPFTYNLRHLSGKQGERLRVVLEKIAGSYSDDPGTSDLDSEQPCYAIRYNLGDVEFVRGLLR